MWLASKSRNELFCCRRRTIRVDLRQYFCYRLLKNSRNDFLLRYIDDAVCIQSEFWNDRKLTKARVIKMPISSATPCALRASFSACIFAATLSALSVLINPATGSASSATTCPSATNASPPLFFRTVLPASIISVSLSPATIRLWESCAMLDATAPHFRLKFDFLTCGLVLPLFYHALPLRKRCQEHKVAPEGLLQLSGATLCALCLGAHRQHSTATLITPSRFFSNSS